ncbi:hypothetical protein PRZ48_014518 [Zasmidium cellare]|uniref:Uncharacterized protein n=1 Tax=Zasmidium cellare TaxID=395010 RepID=A0ABR0DYG9_ZASCE|nr:hypothetical protein PRZ48_014518 [Zasmidium cellare]
MPTNAVVPQALAVELPQSRHSMQVDALEFVDDLEVESSEHVRPILPVRTRNITAVVRRASHKGLIVRIEKQKPRHGEEPTEPTGEAASDPKPSSRRASLVPYRRGRSGPSRAINPVLGAASVDTALTAEPAEYDGLAHYVAQTMLINLLDGERERRAWFELFWGYRTLFHSFHYAAAVHIDLLRNEVSKSTQQRALVHKGAAMSMLKRGLTRLSTTNVDVLLIVMVTLATHDLTEKTLNPGPAMGFRPHEPSAYWMSAYGRLETIKEHLEAIARLIVHIGGLKKLQLPGLGNCLAV